MSETRSRFVERDRQAELKQQTDQKNLTARSVPEEGQHQVFGLV